MIPKYVEVMHCDGGVANNAPHECLPVKTQRIQIPVRRSHIYCHDYCNAFKWLQVFIPGRSSDQSECGTVEVEEHVSCALGCRIKPDHCPPLHVRVINCF